MSRAHSDSIIGDGPETEIFMRKAIQLAEHAKTNGNHPFGAILALDRKVLLRAENTVNRTHNFTHHAEFNLMNALPNLNLSPEDIARCTVYTSCEPCAMCSGAIYWGGVRHVVYGLPCETLGQMAGDDLLIPCRTIFSAAKKSPVQVEGPILEDEARMPHIGFWKKP